MGGKNWELRIATKIGFPPGVRSRVSPYAAGMERTRLTAVTIEETSKLFRSEATNLGSSKTPVYCLSVQFFVNQTRGYVKNSSIGLRLVKAIQRYGKMTTAENRKSNR